MKRRYTRTLFIMAVGTLLLAGVVSLFASSAPDGLERVAIDAGFIDKETAEWKWALFSDYQWSWFGDSLLAAGLPGLIGAVLMFALVWYLGKWMVGRQKRKD